MERASVVMLPSYRGRRQKIRRQKPEFRSQKTEDRAGSDRRRKSQAASRKPAGLSYAPASSPITILIPAAEFVRSRLGLVQPIQAGCRFTGRFSGFARRRGWSGSCIASWQPSGDRSVRTGRRGAERSDDPTWAPPVSRMALAGDGARSIPTAAKSRRCSSAVNWRRRRRPRPSSSSAPPGWRRSRTQRFRRFAASSAAAGAGSRLAIVSAAVPGVRLSEVLSNAQRRFVPPDVDAACFILAQVTTALADLHRHSRDLSHGAIGPERIVIGPDGRAVIVEPVLAPVLEAAADGANAALDRVSGSRAARRRNGPLRPDDRRDAARHARARPRARATGPPGRVPGSAARADARGLRARCAGRSAGGLAFVAGVDPPAASARAAVGLSHGHGSGAGAGGGAGRGTSPQDVAGVGREVPRILRGRRRGRLEGALSGVHPVWR